MLGLPKSTEINKTLPKKVIYEKFKISTADKKVFDEQISRLVIAGEISPKTVNISAGNDVSAVYIIHAILKTRDCDKRNITLLSKLIDQRMLFILQYNEYARLATYRAGRVLVSEYKPVNAWSLKLRGIELDLIWEDIICQITGINIEYGRSLDECIMENEQNEKIIKQIALLEKKAMNEMQPRRKWEFVEEINRLKNFRSGGMQNEEA